VFKTHNIATMAGDGAFVVVLNGQMQSLTDPSQVLPKQVLANQVLDPDAFRRLARARLLPHPHYEAGASSGPSDYDLNPGMAAPPAIPLIAAAVLVPVLLENPLSLLLTERTAHLTAHAGQIAFPGGKIEARDADARSAALREAHEEIGLDPALVETLGYLEPYRTGTGFLITPVVAFVASGFVARPDPAEVADAFTVPLDFLMNEDNHKIDSREWRGQQRRFYAMPFEHRYIWGATAGIIRALYRRLLTP
jgi:8-oxo-dGTP pyrophosphatase MutT (NUDIX family)